MSLACAAEPSGASLTCRLSCAAPPSRFDDDWLACSWSLLPLWDKAPLQPYAPPKHVGLPLADVHALHPWWHPGVHFLLIYTSQQSP